MKKLILAFGAAALMASCNQTTDSSTLETTEVSGETIATYGDAITEENAITAEQLLQQLEDKDSVQAKLVSEVQSSCTKKGCWMKVDAGQGTDPIMVSFKDYGFFVPVDTANPDINKGKTAVMEGWAFREVMSVDDQRHFAEDAGKGPDEIAKITEPKKTITFVADGVILKN